MKKSFLMTETQKFQKQRQTNELNTLKKSYKKKFLEPNELKTL